MQDIFFVLLQTVSAIWHVSGGCWSASRVPVDHAGPKSWLERRNSQAVNVYRSLRLGWRKNVRCFRAAEWCLIEVVISILLGFTPAARPNIISCSSPFTPLKKCWSVRKLHQFQVVSICIETISCNNYCNTSKFPW